MSRVQLAVLGLAGVLAMASEATAQMKPYIGFVYPAGGQQGTTFQIKLGGQGMDDVHSAVVSGKGVQAKLVDYYRRMGPQEMSLLREQLNELKPKARGSALGKVITPGPAMMMASGGAMMAPDMTPMATAAAAAGADAATVKLMKRIETRMAEYTNRPACPSISSLAFLEVKIAPDAKPGPREITLVSTKGVSNPLPFYVGQLPETRRKPMLTAQFQVLGKEELALRKRPDNEVEVRITLPCVMNGQIASGEVNRYRFEAHKGQRLVISADARQLIPFIADAVPGWFQPVMALYDAEGKEVAYDDDYRFKPDPVILFEVPKDGEYVLTMIDAIYRGREDFVYRITIGELPFVTSIFPLGRRVGSSTPIAMKGWNLDSAELVPPAKDAGPGVHSVVARKNGLVSNRVPFALDTLPECFEKEPNNDPSHAQKVTLPVIINGRINRPDDWDVFEFTGHAGDAIVAEVRARRLESPLDSVLKLTDASGKLLAFNDDHEDPEAGTNTHEADSYLTVTLPADGTYYVHLGDTARHGGEEYAYRLRISAPRPDFALIMVPSSLSFRSKGNGYVNIQVVRKDGFADAIKLGLKNPPEGISAAPGWVGKNRPTAGLTIKTDLVETKRPVALTIEGRAKVGDREIVHVAIPAEDRMQAFLWRHLVPARELRAMVFDPAYQPPPKRVRRIPMPSEDEAKAAAAAKAATETASQAAAPPKFTKKQVAGRLRQITLLFEDGLLTDEFDHKKVLECEAAK